MNTAATPVVRVTGVAHRYRDIPALRDIDVDIPAGVMVGLIGPDGVGKSTLLDLIAGARKVQSGRIEVFGGDIGDQRYRDRIAPRIAYMPQGLGKNLYASLSVFENVDFFGRLFGIERSQRHRQIDELLDATALAPFRNRSAGKLSGGMKQKLGLCCALIHAPDLLILDEPTTGIDPLSRRQFWELVDRIRGRRAGMSVIVSTAYMEEAERFDWLVPMNAGRILATGSPEALKQDSDSDSLEAAFISLLPPELRGEHHALTIPPLASATHDLAISAQGLTKRFGDFTAVDSVDLDIRRGEIFGFLGSNGCGKTTTMKMLTGLLPISAGRAQLFGQPVDAGSMAVRRRVGYMSQAFSLYAELTVLQNLELHARLFHLPETRIPERIDQLLARFGLSDYRDVQAGQLPLGIRQRLSLAVAIVHEPELLILDEPTSGVDPIARDGFWELLIELSRQTGVTIFVSTHFMNEAERCDRISLMHAGHILVTDRPQAIRDAAGGVSLEDAFVEHLKAVAGTPADDTGRALSAIDGDTGTPDAGAPFSLHRLLGYSFREALEVIRDPIRLTFALLGSALLMLVLGYGISMDVEDLAFAALDRDGTPASRDYVQNIASSRYFVEQPPIVDSVELDRRMRSGELSLAIEIPPGFGADLKRGRSPEVAMWIDGSMPFRAETVGGYLQGLHLQYLTDLAIRTLGDVPTLTPANLESRYRFNQDFRSIYAMAPAVIPLLLMFIPAILTALSVVREKELGSIVNLYVSPATRVEFLIGKQLPYIAVSMVSFVTLLLVTVYVFDVPIKGDLFALFFATLIYVVTSTGLGLLVSAFTSTQITALAAAAILTMLATVSFSGLTDPVSSLEGPGRIIGDNWPATYYINIVRGIFTKGLDLGDLSGDFRRLLLFPPVLTIASILLLRRQGK